MTTLYVTVFEGGAGSTAHGAPLQEFAVDIDAASTESAAITGAAGTHRTVRLYPDANCSVIWGASPQTAVADGTAGRAMGADNPEYFQMDAGEVIAVITRAGP
jgi:hypothetical protein